MPLNFNPRTPCGVRRGVPGLLPGPCHDFNPRTPCGVRPWRLGGFWGYKHFNPRTPCGVRQDYAAFKETVNAISIHAPRVGCDKVLALGSPTAWSFQSTHPVWGATGRPSVTELLQNYFNPRTPCGVRPCLSHTGWKPPKYFNPRTPCGVRRGRASGPCIQEGISIHAPRVGCDYGSRSPAGCR